MVDVAISVRDLKKYFHVPDPKSHGIHHALRSLVGLGDNTVNKVIDGITFDVKKGECYGIIGPNGTGKSTLMRMLAGVLYPDEGSIDVNGLVFPLLHLGVGFQGELSARDNVYEYGALLGLSDAHLKERFNDIFKYAELEGYENLQLRYFSSGMRVRLAFSIAMEINPDILLLDEVLSVGDVAFKSKSKEKILEICESGKTVVIVSHSTGTISEICDRAMFLKNGKIGMIGEPDDVIDAYLDTMAMFLGPSEIVPAWKRREKKIIEHRDRSDVRVLLDILDMTGLPDLITRIYSEQANETLDQYISFKNLIKKSQLDENFHLMKEGTLDYGNHWSLLIHELGDEVRCRTIARHLLASMWGEGLLNIGRDDFSIFFSDIDANDELFVPKNISVSLLFDDSRMIPLVFDTRERIKIDDRFLQNILKNAGCPSHGNTFLAVSSDLIHEAGIRSLHANKENRFLIEVPPIIIEDDIAILNFLDTLQSPENLLLYESHPLFVRKGQFNLYGSEFEGFGYFDPGLFSKDFNKFYSEIETIKIAFSTFQKETPLKPASYIREVAKKSDRYFSGVRKRGKIEVRPDNAAIQRRHRCLGMILILAQGQSNPLVSYRCNEIRWMTEQWFNHFCQVHSKAEPIQRGKSLLKLIDFTIKIGMSREKIFT